MSNSKENSDIGYSYKLVAHEKKEEEEEEANIYSFN